MRPRISAPALRRALIAGARRVIADRDTLNRINVFPVADGDTGSNLAFTLGSVLTGALSRRCAHAGELLARVGEDAVDGARGNSGAILAQFLQGAAEAIGPAGVLHPAQLAAAVRAGERAARAALSDPREGTILSVIRVFADALIEALQDAPPATDLRGWFERALARARVALADTPKQLAVLERAGVVDAGAQGFVDMLEGIGGFIASGRMDDALPVDAGGAIAQAHADAGFDAQRWCSECLVGAEEIDRLALRVSVESLGASCVVVAGSVRRVRVHAHVDDPQALFETCAQFGTVEACKADDMLLQRLAAGGAAGVAIVTDSAADLPPERAQALGIHVVPLRVNFGERDYLDKVGLATAEFYRKLRTELVLPRTSQPPPGDFRRQFDFLLSHHAEVVYVGLSRAVSGTLQSAERAATREADAGRTGPARPRVRVVDSANAAGGLGLLALVAAERAAAGADADAIVRELERLRPLTLSWAIVRDISHGVRGGRVPRWSKPLVEWFGLTPIARMRPEGRLGIVGALRGRARVPERFAAYVTKRLPPGVRWRLIVGHCDAQVEGQALLAALRAGLDLDAAWLVETGSAIGAHAGSGALVVSVQPV